MKKLLEKISKERSDLVDKQIKLSNFMGTDKFKGLPSREKGLMVKQVVVMGFYIQILSERMNEISSGGVKNENKKEEATN